MNKTGSSSGQELGLGKFQGVGWGGVGWGFGVMRSSRKYASPIPTLEGTYVLDPYPARVFCTFVSRLAAFNVPFSPTDKEKQG